MKGDEMAAKKAQVIGSTDIEIGLELDTSIYVKTLALDEIKQFILDAGSDHLPTFGGRFEGGIHSQQCPDEITPCLAEMLKYGDEIKNYLEIGSAAGGSCFIFHHFFPLDKIVLIDDNKHWKHALRADTLKGIERQELVGRSDDEAVVDAVTKMDTLFDLIVIDSDHDYRNVRLEVALYLPFLRPGGFLFLHDTVYSPQGDGRVMRELAASKEMEFIAEYVSPEGPRCGIGLLRKAVA
jgi:predicted O-methyltransferase YrrM